MDESFTIRSVNCWGT